MIMCLGICIPVELLIMYLVLHITMNMRHECMFVITLHYDFY